MRFNSVFSFRSLVEACKGPTFGLAGEACQFRVGQVFRKMKQDSSPPPRLPASQTFLPLLDPRAKVCDAVACVSVNSATPGWKVRQNIVYFCQCCFCFWSMACPFVLHVLFSVALACVCSQAAPRAYSLIVSAWLRMQPGCSECIRFSCQRLAAYAARLLHVHTV